MTPLWANYCLVCGVRDHCKSGTESSPNDCEMTIFLAFGVSQVEATTGVAKSQLCLWLDGLPPIEALE